MAEARLRLPASPMPLSARSSAVSVRLRASSGAIALVPSSPSACRERSSSCSAGSACSEAHSAKADFFVMPQLQECREAHTSSVRDRLSATRHVQPASPGASARAAESVKCAFLRSSSRSGTRRTETRARGPRPFRRPEGRTDRGRAGAAKREHQAACQCSHLRRKAQKQRRRARRHHSNRMMRCGFQSGCWIGGAAEARWHSPVTPLAIAFGKRRAWRQRSKYSGNEFCVLRDGPRR